MHSKICLPQSQWVPETKMEKYQRLDHIEIWMFQSRDLRPLKIRL